MSLNRKLLVLLAPLVIAGCAGQPAFEDRSGEVRIEHRIPSK